MASITLVLTLTNFIFGFIEGLIALRVLLKLFGANPAAPFVNWIYETSQPLLAPFLGMFPSPRLETGSVIEISALIGLIVYAIIGYLVMDWLRALADRALDHEDRVVERRRR